MIPEGEWSDWIEGGQRQVGWLPFDDTAPPLVINVEGETDARVLREVLRALEARPEPSLTNTTNARS